MAGANENGKNLNGFALELAQALREAFPNQQEGNKIVTQFRQMSPPVLKGNEGPLGAENWIRGIEKIFDYLGCTNEQKVTCAVFQLEEDASHWWESQTTIMTEERRANLTWNTFKDMVLGKFFPKTYRKQKEMELMNLTQGSNTVLEYERKFNQLSCYAPYLVDTDEKKARRFENGLCNEIGGLLAGLNLTSYSEVVERAQAIAIRLNIDNLPARNDRKRQLEDPSDEEIFEQEKKLKTAEENHFSLTNKPLCQECRKHHNGPCLLGKNGCYWCNELGHIAPNCPRRLENAPPRGNVLKEGNVAKKGNARVYCMNSKD